MCRNWPTINDVCVLHHTHSQTGLSNIAVHKMCTTAIKLLDSQVTPPDEVLVSLLSNRCEENFPNHSLLQGFLLG